MWQFLAKGAVSALLVWLLLRNVDFGDVLHRILAADRDQLLIAALLLWILSVPSALRWSTILGAMGYAVRLRILFPLVLIGLFFSITLPSTIGGDAVRMWKIHRVGLSGTAAVVSVMIDRLVALLAILFLVLVSVPAFYGLVPDRAARGGVLLLLGGGFLAYATAMVLDRLPLAFSRSRILRGLAQLSADLRRVLLAPRTAAPALLYSLLNQGGVVGVVGFLAHGLGISVGWLQCLVIVPLAILVTVLPISIAGWGVRETAFVAGFGFAGVPQADAFALSLMFGLLNTLVCLPGGLVWLAAGERRLGARPSENLRSSNPRPTASGE